MEVSTAQVLEVRAPNGEDPVTITLGLSAQATKAIFTALTEQLDRRRRSAASTAEELLRLREETAFVDRFEALAAANAHAVVRLTESELRSCLLELSDYAGRIDGEHFQPVELRERLKTIAELTPVLWDANAAAAQAGGASLPHPVS
jgi:hypothetical protein